jgi:hypothetical protein
LSVKPFPFPRMTSAESTASETKPINLKQTKKRRR